MTYTERLIQAIAPAMYKHIAGQVAKRVVPLQRRCDELEKELGLLKTKSAMRFADVWKTGATYEEGDCVIDKGGLWCARKISLNVRPGTSDSWRLCVKSGGAGAPSDDSARIEALEGRIRDLQGLIDRGAWSHGRAAR